MQENKIHFSLRRCIFFTDPNKINDWFLSKKLKNWERPFLPPPPKICWKYILKKTFFSFISQTLEFLGQLYHAEYVSNIAVVVKHLCRDVRGMNVQTFG